MFIIDNISDLSIVYMNINIYENLNKKYFFFIESCGIICEREFERIYHENEEIFCTIC